MTDKHSFGSWPAATATRFIEDFEGRRLVAYQCSAGTWTIGVGHTEGVHEGMTCTDEQADVWLADDIRKAQSYLSKFINVPVTKGQFIALVSLAFNVGAPYVVQKCPLLMQALNSGDAEEAAKQFMDIDKVNGRPVAGLTRRRRAEAELFLSET